MTADAQSDQALAGTFLVAGPVKLPRVLMIYRRHSQCLSQRSDLMEGGRYNPLHLSPVSGGCGVGSYMLEASCPPDSPLPLPLLLPPPPLSISAAATYLVDRHDALAS